MTTNALRRLGALCGALFAVTLFVGSSVGGHAGIVAGIGGLTLFIPFLAYLCAILREAEGGTGWITATAWSAGLVAITVKLVSVVGEIPNRHRTEGTEIYAAIEDIGNAAFIITLYPLALMFAAVAVVSLETGVLPRWLGFGAAVTAVALVVNAGFIDADFGPAFLLFLVWTLVASVLLYRREGARTDAAPAPYPATT